MPSSSRISLVALLLLATIVAGCGDDDAADTGSSTPPAAAADAFPVTIKHAHGSTTIKSEPKRIVAVGLRDHEPLLALGIKAVGAMDWFQEGTYGKWPWERERMGRHAAADDQHRRFEINFERVAAQRPDLILGIYQEIKRGDYRKLSAIAPTIAQSADHKPYTTPWREETLTIAEAVGRKEQGQRLIDEVDAKFAKVRADHPEFKGKEAMMADPGSGEFFGFTSVDPRGQFLEEMGFTTLEGDRQGLQGRLRRGDQRRAAEAARRRLPLPAARQEEPREDLQQGAVQGDSTSTSAATSSSCPTTTRRSTARRSRSTAC